MISIDTLKEKLQEIPPLPGAAVRLLQMCRDPNVAPSDIVKIIALDPALTMKVLRLCNSPFYGLPRQVNSLSEAIVYLGTDALVNFVLAGCLSNVYSDENEGYGLNEGELWRHVVGVAICSQQIAERTARDLAGLAFTCGLLHDVGKIILNQFVAQNIQQMIRMIEGKGVSFIDAEHLVLGFTHPIAGEEVAASWSLPNEIVESIRYHHDPLSAPEETRRLVSIVHVGNILCVSFGIGIGSDGLAYLFHPGALKLLNIDVDELFALSIGVQEQLRDAQEFLQLT